MICPYHNAMHSLCTNRAYGSRDCIQLGPTICSYCQEIDPTTSVLPGLQRNGAFFGLMCNAQLSSVTRSNPSQSSHDGLPTRFSMTTPHVFQVIQSQVQDP